MTVRMVNNERVSVEKKKSILRKKFPKKAGMHLLQWQDQEEITTKETRIY